MPKTLYQELDEFQRTLGLFRKQYDGDDTITSDERDRLDALLKKIEHLLMANVSDVAAFSLAGGDMMAAPHNTTSPQIKPVSPPKVKPAPKYEKMGLAEFLPPNKTTGLRLWNFSDGSPALDKNQERALKSTFFVTMKESHKYYEIIGYTSGIGLDAAGGTSLATKRAREVREFLIQNGINKDKFVRTYGNGSTSPLAKDMNDGKPWAEGAARNRRVDILPTDNNMVVPDNVVDDMGGVGDVGEVSDGGDPDGKIRDKLPPGQSDETAKWLTVGAVSLRVVTVAINSIFVGGAGAIIAPAIAMMQVANAWQQAQKEANRRGGAYGFKLGTSAAVTLIRGGKDRVSPEQLWTLSKPKAKQFGNRRIPLDWWEIERDISIGVQQSADIVNKAMELTESELLKILHAKFGTKNGSAIYDANIRMVRSIMAEKLADRIAKEVTSILSGA